MVNSFVVIVGGNDQNEKKNLNWLNTRRFQDNFGTCINEIPFALRKP